MWRCWRLSRVALLALFTRGDRKIAGAKWCLVSLHCQLRNTATIRHGIQTGIECDFRNVFSVYYVYTFVHSHPTSSILIRYGPQTTHSVNVSAHYFSEWVERSFIGLAGTATAQKSLA